MKRFLIRVSCVLISFLAAAFSASAQWSSATSELSSVQTTISGVATTIINIASIVIGLIGMGSLALAYAKHNKADPSAADALTKVGFGLIIVIVIIQVIKMTLLS